MSRQRILIILLVLVAVISLPSYFIDRTVSRLSAEMTGQEPELILLREKANKVQELELQLAEQQTEMANLEQRLISAEPFIDMERELRLLATRADLQVVEITLGGAEELPEMPSLQQYTATVEIAGSTASYAAFVRLLEEHRLLIGIPDLKIGFPRETPAFRTRLTIHFYGKAPGGK